MDIGELRIGNKIADGNGRILTVHTIAPTYVRCTLRNSSFALDDLRPIELTPEILEKAGFDERRKNAWYKDRLQWNSHLVYLKNEDTEECYYIPNTVKYVHQLQNLFYCCTGTELNVEL